MCGIAGSLGRIAPEPRSIEAALRSMAHRGPDAQGVHTGFLGGWAVCLLHARLAVIDLDPRAHQPFIDRNLAVVFNGEIYNYLEIRATLEGLGHAFATSSDTEVLVKAWRQWGDKAFDRFEGMWAFALIDMERGRFILSRDRFGEKPLFICRRNGTLYFASEVKTLAILSGAKPEVNQDQIRRYLVHGYKSLYAGSRCWFSDIEEVPNAHWLEIGQDLESTAHEYWALSYSPQAMTPHEAEEEASHCLNRAVALRLRSDVPIAFCLSGGVDSTMLAAIAAKRIGASINAFSIIETDERYDESKNIRCAAEALGCRLTEIHVRTDGFWERMQRLVAGHDGPVATLPYYMHSFISEAIHAEGVKVAISGTGADELFTGYYDHYNMWLATMRGSPDIEKLLADWRDSYGAFVSNPFLKDPLIFAKQPNLRDHIFLDAEEFQSYLTNPLNEGFSEMNYCEDLLRNRMLNELFRESVPVILKEDDLNSMMFSIENRVPFLDRALAEFMYKVPNEFLIKDGYPKWLLRAAGVDILPDQVRLDKRKRGFNLSILSLIDPAEPGMREKLLSDGPIWDLLKRERVEKALAGDLSRNSLSKFLFSFVSARLFLDHFQQWRVAL